MRAPMTILMSGLLLLASPVAAATPHVMNFQARLSDAAGVPIIDGTRIITFSIYDDSTGGSVIWTENQVVQSLDGAFTVLLGSVQPLEAAVFAEAPRYIGIRVEGEPEISPRTAVGAVPYAFQASSVAASAAQAGMTPDTLWVAPYFRAIAGAPLPMALTIISVYNADTVGTAVTLSFYNGSGNLISTCSRTIAPGALWLFKSNSGDCGGLTNHEGYVIVSAQGPVAPAGIIMAGSTGSPTLAPASANMSFFKL